MQILVIVISLLIALSLSGGGGIAFLIAAMCGVIYSQGRRLKALEKLQSLSLPSAPQTPKVEKATADFSPKIETERTPAREAEIPVPSAAEIPVVSKEQTPPQASPQLADVTKRTESVVKSPSVPATPPRSTSEIIEGLFGPTISGFILRGNPIARIGVVILFFGVIFALKFVADEGFFPIELRLLCAALGAFALLGLGWKLRKRSRQFSVTLQGAGAGVFYITAFIAFRLHHLIPGPLAFALLLGITILSAALAVLQNARSLAVAAMIGGFLAPALTSEGGGSHLMLFSYLAILNLGIFGVCWFRSWRELNLLGFIFTFLLASTWGERYYQPEFFATSDAFLIFFLVLYTVINVLFASRSNDEKPGPVDSLMTFGTALWAFFLQYGLVKDIEYGLAWSAVGFGAFYIIVARIAFNIYGAKLKLLAQSYFFIGLCFLSLAVPLAFSGRLTAAIWAVEGLALIWSGIKQKHGLTRFAGEVLLLLSSFFFFIDMRFATEDFPFLNPFFEGVALLTLTSLFSARLLAHADKDSVGIDERKLAPFLSFLGLAWWLGGGYLEVWRNIARWHNSLSETFPSLAWGWIPWGLNVYSAFATFSVLLFWFLARRFATHDFRFLRTFLMPVHILVLIALFFEAQGTPYFYRVHPFMSLGFATWAFLFVAHYGMLAKEEAGTEKSLSPSLHVWGLFVASTVVTWEIFSQVGRLVPDTTSWALSMLELIPALLLMIIAMQSLRASRWPFRSNAAVYLKSLGLIVVWLLSCTIALDFSQSGAAYPLPYLPLLNPLDIGQAIALLALVRWWIVCNKTSTPVWLNADAAAKIIGAWLFLWATILLLRCMHHYGGVAWGIDELLDSNAVQAALSIFWCVLALILMTTAHIKAWRPVWKSGACLIAVVVVKLFLVDLSSQATIARIAAFLGVGLLMLCIGYFAPIPPNESSKK